MPFSVMDLLKISPPRTGSASGGILNDNEYGSPPLFLRRPLQNTALIMLRGPKGRLEARRAAVPSIGGPETVRPSRPELRSGTSG
ncbi:hypothetical protein K32_04850 [Kaistia sp. 32K]|nr:hypothetical protein K32_04850 [Kaistia sp. 32K]